jgi:hypothetical protein
MPRTLLLALVLLLSGCHRYVAVRAGSVPPGSQVRVHLTPEGVERIGSAYGSATGIIDGELDSWADEVVVNIPVQASPGMLDRGLVNKIVIAQADIVAVELQQRDPTRTAALSIGLGAVVALTAIAVFGGVFGGTTIVDNPPPEDILVPRWLRIFP